MPKGRLLNATPRACMVCGNMFTPSRNKQWFCGKATGRNCAQTQRAREVIAELAAERGASLDERPCQKCGTVYKPHAIDQKTCAPDCPGRPSQERVCASPDCEEAFTIPGNSVGRGMKVYCSKRCRDHVARIRQGQRFRRYADMPREEFERRGTAQDWRCMICGREPEPDPRRKNLDPTPYLHVDHDHASGRTRDLLCSDCNLGIGMFHEDPDAMLRAIDYVVMWRHVHAGEEVEIPDYFAGSAATAPLTGQAATAASRK